jgi:uncharacterized membrane protein
MEKVLQTLNAIVVGVCQFLAMGVISVGVGKALWIYLRDALTPGRSAAAIQRSRMELGHSFSLALGFLIGASILKTTLAPTWTDIGQLAAIIAIRTALNFFLLRDIAIPPEERDEPLRTGRLGRLFRGRRGIAPGEAPSDDGDAT